MCLGEQIYVSIPLDGQLVAGSVNEPGVRQNLNCLNHWCCERKQETFIFKLSDFMPVSFCPGVVSVYI